MRFFKIYFYIVKGWVLAQDPPRSSSQNKGDLFVLRGTGTGNKRDKDRR